MQSSLLAIQATTSLPTIDNRNHPRPVRTSPDLYISVIVPVRNEAGCLGGLLDQLLDQQYNAERYEIIVADGQSTDATRRIASEYASKHARVRLVDNPRRWSSAGRNAAIAAARGDIMLIVDGHCELDDRHYLAKVAGAFERTGADCLGRPQPLDLPGGRALQTAISLARSSRLGHHPASHIYRGGEHYVKAHSVAVAYRRAVFDKLGIFDETFDACEDVEFNHRIDRAGLRCFFTSAIKLRYHPRGSLRGLFLQMRRYGRGRARLLRKHPKTLSAASCLPAIFVLGALSGLPLAAAVRPLAPVYVAVMLFYSVAVAAAAILAASRGRRHGLAPLVALSLTAVHFGAGAGFIEEIGRGLVSRRPWAQRPRAALTETASRSAEPSGA